MTDEQLDSTDGQVVGVWRVAASGSVGRGTATDDREYDDEKASK